MATIRCSKCGCTIDDCANYFTRTNPVGEIGIWECAKGCGNPLTKEESLLAAIQTPTRLEKLP